MSDRKDELVALFEELAELTLLDEGDPQSFRVRAYENAAFEIPGINGDLEAMSVAELAKHRGIGKSTAQKIREYLDTGTIARLEELRATYPAEFVALGRIPGLGPKKLLRLRDELGIGSLDDLHAAIAAERIRALKGFGRKTEENIARAIERMGIGGKQQRTPIGEALAAATALVAELEPLPEVEQALICGSLRRFRETIGDVDIVAASTAPAPIMARLVGMASVAEVLGHGDTKSSVVTRSGLQIDLRVVEPAQFGAATLYFTGSKAHNIRLRQRALDRGWTLNEYALAELATGEVVASRTEKDIYDALGLQYVPPPMREDTGEVELAAEGALPEVVRDGDLRGDLHVHTDLSAAGASSLDDMVAAAAARGYAYLAITDHGAGIEGGAGREALLRQRDRIAALAARHPDVTVLWGCELDIGADGELDLDDELRAALGWCVAAVHSHLDLDQARQTRRIVRAMHDPAVDVIGHLSARLLGERPGIPLDVDAVLAAAVETGTALEINAAPARLDAGADVLRRARDRGVTFAIGSDARRPGELERVRGGVLHAQRGWVERDAVVNTWPLERLREWRAARRKT